MTDNLTSEIKSRFAAVRDRGHRVDVYADWLHHDCDGLAWNLSNPTSPVDGATAILAAARVKLCDALALLDDAIAADRSHNSEQGGI